MEQACARPHYPDPDDFPNGNPAAPYNPPAVRNTDSCLAGGAGPVLHNYRCEGPAPGAIAFRWAYGSVCAATNRDPEIQIVAYNEDTYILRENVCVHWEAPFTYLLFGNEGALLIDTGATEEAEYYPLCKTVDALMARWCQLRRRRDLPLTVAFTSAEDKAQNQGRKQFAGRPKTTLVPAGLAELKSFYGLATNWPQATGSIDLGGRVIEVIPTPGTHKDGVSFYDPYSKFLFTGDLFYPGRIQIANLRDYSASLERLAAWTCAHPVKWLMGGHIEMMFAPGRAYPRFTNYKPYERLLQMDPALLDDALEHAKKMPAGGAVMTRADYALLYRVSPDAEIYHIPKDMPDVPVSFWLPL
jgi:glyoxylase-like metal-dependent hydrolase (beta-lactamase superfamily II)